jgi:hypothetical protein
MKEKHIKIEKTIKETKEKIKKEELYHASAAQKAKAIFVEIDDEITSDFDQIKKCKNDNIVLIVPKEAVLFQSVINLKILKNKTEEINKNITLVTKDRIGLHLGAEAGLTMSENIDAFIEIKNKADINYEINISPIKASQNQILTQNLKKISTKKQNIIEILQNLRRKKEYHFFSNFFSTKIKRPKILTENKLSISIPNRRALTTLIIFSIIILFISAYIILPGATIYLTPKSNVISQSTNVILADNNLYASQFKASDQYMIPMYIYETDLSLTMPYYSTGKLFEGTNAVGKIKLFNVSNNPWELLPKTRLQTSEGLVFRTQAYSTIPPKNADGSPGTLVVNVISDEFDIFAQVIGDKGNIPPSKFFLPGLNSSNQKLLYGESFEAMIGGKTAFKEIVTKDDLFAAEELIKNKLVENMKESLTKELEILNKKYKTNFKLLLDDDLIEKDKIKVEMPQDIIDKILKQFDVKAEMHVSALYYNYDELVEILKTEIIKHTNPKKKLVKTYDQNLQFEIVDIDKKNKKIKITVNMQGLEEYDLDENSESGQRIIQKIKSNILGKNIDEANNFIQNLPEINKVDISSWPKWSISIPTLPENIKIKVMTNEK